MSKKNQEIRLYAKGHDVFLWEIAEAMGVGESTLYRWLRATMTPQEEQKYINTIDQIARRKAGKA